MTSTLRWKGRDGETVTAAASMGTGWGTRRVDGRPEALTSPLSGAIAETVVR